MAILNYSHVVSVAPASEPVTAAEAKRHCDVDDSDRDDDFTRWITEARVKVENDCRRALITQTHVLRLDAFPSGDYIELPMPPAISVTSLQYVDTGGSTQTFSDSTLDANRTPGAVFLDYGKTWPATRDQRNAVIVTYTAGYGASASDTPAAARNAILLLVKHRFEHPELAGDKLTEVPKGYDDLVGSSPLFWGDYP